MKKFLAILMVLVLVSGALFADGTVVVDNDTAANNTNLIINARSAGIGRLTITDLNQIVDLSTVASVPANTFRTAAGTVVGSWALQSTYTATKLYIHTDAGFGIGAEPTFRVPYVIVIKNTQAAGTPQQEVASGAAKTLVGSASEGVLAANSAGVFSPANNAGTIAVKSDGNGDEYMASEAYVATVIFYIETT